MPDPRIVDLRHDLPHSQRTPQRVPAAERCGITCHRILPREGLPPTPTLDAEQLVREVAALDVTTLGWSCCAYVLLVASDGTVYQTSDLEVVTPHALYQNRHRYGVGMLGDFRRETPPPAQWAAGAWLCAGLTALSPGWRAPDERTGPEGLVTFAVAGHRPESPRSTRDAHKVCPGHLWPMDRFREAVATDLTDTWDALDPAAVGARLAGAGLVLEG